MLSISLKYSEFDIYVKGKTEDRTDLYIIYLHRIGKALKSPQNSKNSEFPITSAPKGII